MHKLYRSFAGIVTGLAATGFIACSSGNTAESDGKYHLTSVERVYCDSLHIDSSLIVLLRQETPAKLNVFIPEPIWVYLEDGTTVQVPSKLTGLYFEAEQTAAKAIVSLLSTEFQKKGHTIYVCEENFGTNGSKDKVAIVNTADKYELLQEAGTDGVNYDIDNDSLLKIIHFFDEKYQLTLIGANYDWCEFSIGKEPTNWMKLAEECYAVCPDIVDQGTGTVEDLATELKRTKTIYFWWD